MERAASAVLDLCRADAPQVRTTYLVACVSRKRLSTVPAQDLYISEWFTRARRYVECAGGRWFILSSLHGLLTPDQVIAPYEKTLSRTGMAERRLWASRVCRQLESKLPQGGHVVVLAGQAYREHLMAFLQARGRVEVPMEGLGLGEQLHWLAAHTMMGAPPVREPRIAK